MTTLKERIDKGEQYEKLIKTLRKHAKTDNGKNLSGLGQDLILAFANNDYSKAEVARLLDISAPAVTQQYAKVKLEGK